MKKNNSLLYWLTGFLLLLALYFGIGGMGRVEYKLEYEDLLIRKPALSDTVPLLAEGIPFKNNLERMRWLKSEEEESFDKLFVGVENVPDLIALLLTACSFSMIGALTNLLFMIYRNTRTMTIKEIVLCSILGFLAGLFVIGLTYLIPTALVKSTDTQVRPFTLMFTSLFAGFCFMKFYKKIFEYFDKAVNVNNSD